MSKRNEREEELNIALLIDADNASPDHLDEVLTVLAEWGEINIRRAYGNWRKHSLRSWADLTGRHSIVPVQQFDVVKGKSATDMRMVIDAMDLLYKGHVGAFGIMSSDSDFLPLAQRIREGGIPVYGFGTAKAPESFQQGCTRFYDTAKLVNENGASEVDNKIDQGLLDILGNAYKQSKRDEEGYTPLSEMGQRAKAVSSFAVRNYGFTRLSDLVRSLDYYDVKKDADGRLVVKRLR
ncbi:NYN domain-containing protein [Sphingomicrobium sediminis]|uniref:NYN domain-containing protein n=1 Tax=Sphingomicrobium sediminis TaxID=2950949 RepID=A0A9X2J115_9SPHN|nr:NYN domain-containing protein [Sphingomicrobium sediminis]MCM8556793.1 NYN domain-containing protein [Sphingomicrobium sediminis]